jgi:cytohesin
MAAGEAIAAIHRAAWQGDAVSVTRMLDEDPRLLSSAWGGDTLLHAAIWKGHMDVMRLLLERGAAINQANVHGSTALHYAASRGHEEMVSLLVRSGADPSRKTYRGQTALMRASWGGHVAVAWLLLRSMGGRELLGRVLNERTEGGRTALCYACFEGHADVVRALLLAGADHTISHNDGRTPLQIAQEKDHRECVALFQVSTSLVSRSSGHQDGAVFAVCGAHVV